MPFKGGRVRDSHLSFAETLYPRVLFFSFLSPHKHECLFVVSDNFGESLWSRSNGGEHVCVKRNAIQFLRGLCRKGPISADTLSKQQRQLLVEGTAGVHFIFSKH